MAQIREEGLPEYISRATHGRHRHKAAGGFIQNVDFDTVDGGVVTVPMQRPAAILAHAASACAPFAELLRTALAASEGDCLRLVMYMDEVETADPLKKGERTILAVYWSLFEFGPDALCNEECWFTLATVRTEPVIDSFLDGYAQLMCKVLDVFFAGPESLTAGVTVDVLSGAAGGAHTTHLLLVRLAVFIADEKAIKQLTSVKGSAGRKLCLFCCNVKAWRFFKPDPHGFHVPSTCLDKASLKLHTDRSLKEACNKVLRAKGTLGKTQFEEYERDMGVGYNEKYHPLLRDDFLPISTIMFDPQHVYFSEGIFTVELSCFFDRLEAADVGLGFEAVDAYLRSWIWPKAYTSGANIFKKGKLQATASQLVSAAPVIKKWVQSVPQRAGVLLPECESMVCLCDVVECVQGAIHGTVDADIFESKIYEHLGKQQAAYGTECWKAKNKHAMHLADMYRTHKRLFACFTMERKHKVPKRFAAQRVNTKAYEQGLLEEVTDQHLWELKQPLLATTLTQPRPATQTMSDAVIQQMNLLPDTNVSTSLDCRVQGRTVRRGDVVWLVDNTVALIWFVFGVGDVAYACVSRWPLAREVSDTCIVVHVRDVPLFISVDLITQSLIYKMEPINPPVATVLVPRAIRR
jgi:hypothetical protein